MSLGCTVIIGTAVNISWLFGGSPAPGRHTVSEVEGQLSGKLELDAVTAEHDGQFVCVAVGSQREQSSATISVTVRSKYSGCSIKFSIWHHHMHMNTCTHTHIVSI